MVRLLQRWRLSTLSQREGRGEGEHHAPTESFRLKGSHDLAGRLVAAERSRSGNNGERHPLVTSSGLNLDPEDLAGLALDHDFKRPATGLAVRGESLHPLTGIDGHRAILSAKRAFDLFEKFHNLPAP